MILLPQELNLIPNMGFRRAPSECFKMVVLASGVNRVQLEIFGEVQTFRKSPRNFFDKYDVPPSSNFTTGTALKGAEVPVLSSPDINVPRQ